MPDSTPSPDLRVLIIDDEPMVLVATRIVLKSAGFHVVTADAGEEGLAMAIANAPDAILLDVMMPDVDGWEILGRLRAHPATENVPVLMFTAREHTRGSKLARDLGAAAYIRKPFDADDLIATVRRHAEASRSQTNSTVEASQASAPETAGEPAS